MKTTFLPSFDCEVALVSIGTNLRKARLRRNESVQFAADRIGISRSKYQRMEKGDTAISAGAMLDALIQYGFQNQVFELGSPEIDKEGIRLEQPISRKRGRTTAKK